VPPYTPVADIATLLVPAVASLTTASVQLYDLAAVGWNEIAIAAELPAPTVPLVGFTKNTEVHSVGDPESPVNVNAALPVFRIVSVAVFV
jgi:hypothetical protein